MAEELKIVIDAEVRGAITGIQNVSKVISADFTKATNVAAAASFDLSKSVAEATARINASIDKMVDKALGGSAQLKTAFSSTSVSGGGFGGFVKSAQQAQTAIDNLAKKGAGLNSFYSGIITANTKAAASFNKIPSAANTSGQAILNFGRVIQDAPFGILGIANNFNPLLESFQRAQVAAKETGTSLSKNLVGALVGPAGVGLAVSLVSSLLIVFGDKLFGATKSLSDAEIQARKFTASLADIKTGIDQFFSNLEFEQGLQKLKNKLNLGDAAEVFNIGLDKTSADKIVKETNEQITKATNEIARIVNNKTQFLSKSGQNLAETFFSSLQTGTTVDVSGLNEADTKIFNILNENATRINALQEQNTKARRISAEADVKIELQKQSDLKKLLDKQRDDFEKFVNDTIARARQFNEEFGNAFVVPDLKESFFVKKTEVFKRALKELSDISKGNLKIKIPIQTEFDLLPVEQPITDEQLKELTKGFFEGIRLERNIPLEITFDPTISPEGKAILDKKINLKNQFKILGEIGNKEFDKIFKNIADTNFEGLNAGIAEATKQLKNMMDVANTLNQAIGGGLVNAFNSVFDSILEGKSVFKALGEAIKQLVIGTIKAIAQMLILKAITNLIFPGSGIAGSAGKLVGAALGGNANFGGIGGSPFSNIIQIVGDSRISGNDIVTSYSRTSNSNSRFGG